MSCGCQLPTDSPTGELTGVQVQVEAGRVAPDGADDRWVGDRHRARGRCDGGRHPLLSEQAHLDRAVHAFPTRVDVP